MNCNNCENEISPGASFCIKCGAALPQSTATSRLLTAPNYLFIALFVAHFVSYLIKGFPLHFSMARSVGVNIIPLAFGVFYTFSGSRTSRTIYLVATVLFMVIFVGATLQSFKDGS